jgi:methionyl-tRNA formyltransferase
MNEKKIILIGKGELYKIIERNLKGYVNTRKNNLLKEKLIIYPDDFDINASRIKADLIISAGHSKRITKPLEKGIPCFNIHLSPLPKYAGFNPFYWAIKNDEKEWGVTLHKIVFDFDAGDIISQRKFPISKGDTARSLYDLALTYAEIMFKENLESLITKNYKTKKQNLSQRTFYPKNYVNYDKEIIFDNSEECWREIRARYFPPFPFPKIKNIKL